MANFAYDIKEAVGDDTILAVAIKMKGGYYQSDSRFNKGNELAGKIASYQEALEALNYSYDSGYGSIDCHDIIMWSASRVYYIHEYDGSTAICNMPRNPLGNAFYEPR